MRHRSTINSRARSGLRWAERNFRKPKEPPRCREISRGDEDYCPGCGMAWPAVEDKPPCPNKEPTDEG